MDRCPVCSGRIIKASEGDRCMNAKCEGSKGLSAQEGVICTCGQPMHYTNLNSWGEPNYSCSSCGATTKL